MAAQIYILTATVNIGQQGGVDLPGCMEKIQKLMCSYSGATKCVHKYKVTGEATVVAVFEVSNVIGLERTVAGLARLGNIDVTCKPLIHYGKFAEYLDVPNSSHLLSENSLASDKQLLWLQFTLEYPGKSTQDLVATWAREAAAVINARSGGLHLELYKNVMERKVHCFIAIDPIAGDKLSFELPVMQENGNGVTIVAHAVHNLDDYCSRISSETFPNTVSMHD
ncbi:uncharacterized protein LOC127872916 [Dreissena polymorpha]|uniref:Uncharacterized protein n=1 Tax=Dreissena polymorpha TaxID=45954 RepID=A0A9D4LAM2_DREPO|nr:uncharacterized protein LOC127872916 [Dreissena polymorpha]XP_052272409.1 uncharacterized protein LOC127872916 [Dreissena polymorpha]XP_052272410.1 uncharacterized protein LOC127872916 [Dreissena polymorpha]KAH3854545.1 hypothetical protein DPMN_097088 [Dreissena polymorpha]